MFLISLSMIRFKRAKKLLTQQRHICYVYSIAYVSLLLIVIHKFISFSKNKLISLTKLWLREWENKKSAQKKYNETDYSSWNAIQFLFISTEIIVDWKFCPIFTSLVLLMKSVASLLSFFRVSCIQLISEWQKHKWMVFFEEKNSDCFPLTWHIDNWMTTTFTRRNDCML